MLSKLSKAVLLIGMGINGAFYLAWFLSSGPDRLGYWYLIYFLVFPYLFIFGLLALAAHETLRLSKWVGGAVLIYVGSLTALLMGSGLGLLPVLDWLPQGSFEVFHMVAWVLALVGLLFAMRRR